MPAHAFLSAHATHPSRQVVVDLCIAQLQAQIVSRDVPMAYPLGLCYLTDYYAADAEAILATLKAQLPGTEWVGAVGVGVCASGVEYFDQPALSLLLAPLPAADFRVFSGRRPLGRGDVFEAHTALVHAEGSTPDLQELLVEQADRTATGYLFGGLSASRERNLAIADEVLSGGLCGVAFSPRVEVISRVTQGCQPVGPARRVVECQGNYLIALDGGTALGCALDDLGLPEEVDHDELARMLAATLVGISRGHDDTAHAPGRFGSETLVRHILGVDPEAEVLAVAETLEQGMELSFCARNPDAALADLARIARELHAAAAGRQIAGALYVSCSGRGGAHFGRPNAELETIRDALGDVPLTGFFAGGEIARDRLYGYTGVLTLFLAPAPASP
ncbi:MAG: FIST C-terminal domain-containing protein [Rhodocyclaceae bacterium]|nr:FIST C-terminal domain-containing protein [Rhodocyclaceae bacterium]